MEDARYVGSDLVHPRRGIPESDVRARLMRSFDTLPNSRHHPPTLVVLDNFRHRRLGLALLRCHRRRHPVLRRRGHAEPSAAADRGNGAGLPGD